jgi:predicted RNase H-like nuclease (RuvC/YqgF family)
MLRARLSTREDEVTLLSRKVEEMEAEISNLRLQLDDKIVKITMLESISEQNDAEFPTDKQ